MGEEEKASSEVPVFTEHTNADGRTYWYNPVDKSSVWEKPDSLKTPFERELANTAWKEYMSKGRKYWVHKETKESVWDMPEELIFLLEKVGTEEPEPVKIKSPDVVAPSPLPTASSTNALVPVGFNSPAQFSPPQQQQQQFDTFRQPAPSFSLPTAPKPQDQYVIPEGGWRTKFQAEQAFMYLLNKQKVDPAWTWDQTMRAIITDPLYKSFPSLAEKKAVFTKFVSEAKARQTEEKESRMRRIRGPFRSLLSDHPAIYPYTTFKTADALFAGNAIWSQAKGEEERKGLFEEYIAELKQKETTELRDLRNRNILKLTSLLKTLSISMSTRWREAQELVSQSPEWKSDEQLRRIDTLEVLILFEDYMKELEREHDLRMRKKKMERSREGRRARDAFKALLQTLVAQEKITSKSRFKTVRPLIANTDAYLELLGKPGSTPLELFQDVVDDLEVKLESEAAVARDAFEKVGKTFLDSTKQEDFDVVVGDKLGEDVRVDVYNFMKDKVIAKQVEEAKKAERKRRHLIEDLRYALKRVEPPLSLDASYEDSLPQISDLVPELSDDEDRRFAYSKFIKRQKEKLRDASPDRRGGRASDSRRDKEGDVVMDYGATGSRSRVDDDRRERERKSSRKDRGIDEDRGSGSKRPRVTEPAEIEEGEI
ncbi:hypothetical protein BDY24DRAFT_15127 [Mrakia frigida]|uniref:snoRNA-splicing protein PRP40 n=1 Tax=Mrakia frigida TaxID=29902 RepID=UPI003FCC20E8